MSNELQKKDIFALAEALEKKEFSSVELTKAYLQSIKEKDEKLCAYITVCETEALSSAEQSDARRSSGSSLGILDGIPFSAKDNFCTRGIPTTCGSAFLEGYIPPFSASALSSLTASGAILLGKTNMDEFGMGSFTENSAYKITRNPLDTSRTAGGSSGGSAASVAASMAAFSVGSDTGGSVRQPASFCGIVGLKPTYGRISRYGLVAFAPSLDTVGILAKTPSECGLLLSLMSGKDEKDATSLSTAPYAQKDAGTRGLRAGIVSELSQKVTDPAVRSAIENAIKALSSAGILTDELSIPSVKLASECYYIISSCEASSNLARFDGIRYGKRAKDCDSINRLYLKSRTEGFGDEVKRRIMLGTFALSAGYYDDYYARAQSVRRNICDDLISALEKYDLLLMPTALSGAPLLNTHGKLSEVYADDICALPASLCGLPAISVPFGKDEKGMPIGIQLVSGRLREDILISAANALLEVDRHE